MTESGAEGGRTSLTERARGLTLGDAFRRLTVVSFAALCLAVAVVGVVAVVAESVNTWTWYFRMERAMALGTPLVIGLVAVTLGGAMGSMVFTRDWE